MDPSSPQPTANLSQQLIEAFETKALQRGSFVLASGKTASFYLDAKQVVLDAAGAMLVGQAVLARLQELGPLPDAVGGMSIGADPITAAVVTMAGVAGVPLKGFMIRKEPKGHGLGRYVEGPVKAGNRVVILEDVVTTGGSSLLAIDRAEEFGLSVDRVVTLVDRLAGGADAFAARGIPMESMLTIRDLGIEPAAAS